MLDTKAGWDELIRRHAPDAKVREAVLANPLYVNITSRFVHSHDYLAMEQLHELHASGRFDLIIVDTPPSRNALDVLDAPGRMKEFFGSRLLKLADGAVPLAVVHGRLEAVLLKSPTASSARGSCRTSPSSSSCSRRWRSASSPTPREVERAARRPPHHVRRRVDARSGTRPRGDLPGTRAANSRDIHLGAIVANRVLPAGITAKAPPTAPSAWPRRVRRPLATASRPRSTCRPTSSSSTLRRGRVAFHDTAMVATRRGGTARRAARASRPSC